MGTSVVIAGGSGFLGLSLAEYLAGRGYEVTILSRSVPMAGPWRHVAWDARTMGAWSACLDGAGALVNLVGRSVNCVKTPAHCDEILRSRVEATRVLGEACRSVDVPPAVWVQMSTAHIYGDPPSAVCDETSATGYGLAPTVGVAWEEAFARAKLASQRGVILRTSFVIGRDRGGHFGALSMLRRLARLGLGGTVATGTQGMSWIHEEDMNAIFARAIADHSMQGVYVASAPQLVSQREFMRTLRPLAGGLGAVGVAPPAFGWLVRVAAPLVFGTDPELVLYGRYVVPTRLMREGFGFTFATLDAALRDLCARGGPGARAARL
jgi:uncharacterized protein (TIGR01777 family)